MTILSRFASLMWLGILTFLFCIPVVTAGASITAMYYERNSESKKRRLDKNEKGNFTTPKLFEEQNQKMVA